MQNRYMHDRNTNRTQLMYLTFALSLAYLFFSLTLSLESKHTGYRASLMVEQQPALLSVQRTLLFAWLIIPSHSFNKP